MIRLIQAIILATAISSSISSAVEVSVEDLKEFKAHIENLKLIEEALPIFEIEPWTIIIDDQGRLYYPESINVKLKLAYLTYEVKLKLNPIVERQEPRQSLFSFRYKIGGYLNPLADKDEDSFGASFLFEPIRYKHFGLNGYVGSSSAGGALSIDILKNAGVFGGAGLDYGDSGLAVVVGVFASLN